MLSKDLWDIAHIEKVEGIVEKALSCLQLHFDGYLVTCIPLGAVV